MNQFIQIETLIIELLLVVSLVAIAVRRLRIPYTIALVLIGLVLSAQQWARFELTPELILTIFVPPLVFEAAFHLNINELRRNLLLIVLLAVPGVILTMFVVAGVLALGAAIPLSLALVFGALIAATDPVAVIALFRTLGTPKRLELLVEAESLLNDGTAIVLFNLVLMMLLNNQKFNLIDGIGDFVRVSAGGIIVGGILGWVTWRLIARVDDYLIETTLTTILAFGSYLVAERLEFSGVLAVVAAGLINGNFGRRGMSPTTRLVLFSFWDYVAFLANSLIFLLIGIQVDLPDLLEVWQPLAWTIAAVLLARVIVVYGLGWIANRLSTPVPLRWQHIIYWGGLRGAVSLALALSLPASLGDNQSLLRTMTFGVVLFSLFIQGITMRPLLLRLGIIKRNEMRMEYELRRARLAATQESEKHLDMLHQNGLISTPTWEQLKPMLSTATQVFADAVRDALHTQPNLEDEEMDMARREILQSQRSALIDLQRNGVISDEILERLTAEIDAGLSGAEVPPFTFKDSVPPNSHQAEEAGKVETWEEPDPRPLP